MTALEAIWDSLKRLDKLYKGMLRSPEFQKLHVLLCKSDWKSVSYALEWSLITNVSITLTKRNLFLSN